MMYNLWKSWLNITDMTTPQLTPNQLARNRHVRLVGQTALTRGDEPPQPAVQYVILDDMKLMLRQWRVLNQLRVFQQLTTKQIHDLEFHGLTRYPCDDTLKRLLALGLIEKVSQHQPGGERGGSNFTIYQLSTKGWKHFPDQKRRDNRVVSPHALVVAGVYLSALQASRDGWLSILEWQVEADAWVNVAGADIRPDLFLKLLHIEKNLEHRYNVEVDLGNERQRQINEKLERYIYASQHVTGYPDGDTKQRQVLFLTDTDERAADLKRMVKRSGAPEGMVLVHKIESFPQFLR